MNETRCGLTGCDPCTIERIGCGCDGSMDDGCFLCTPSQHARPACRKAPSAHFDARRREYIATQPDGTRRRVAVELYERDVPGSEPTLWKWSVDGNDDWGWETADDALAAALASLGPCQIEERQPS